MLTKEEYLADIFQSDTTICGDDLFYAPRQHESPSTRIDRSLCSVPTGVMAWRLQKSAKRAEC
jgi:hypothetical protein